MAKSLNELKAELQEILSFIDNLASSWQKLREEALKSAEASFDGSKIEAEIRRVETAIDDLLARFDKTSQKFGKLADLSGIRRDLEDIKSLFESFKALDISFFDQDDVGESLFRPLVERLRSEILRLQEVFSTENLGLQNVWKEVGDTNLSAGLKESSVTLDDLNNKLEVASKLIQVLRGQSERSQLGFDVRGVENALRLLRSLVEEIKLDVEVIDPDLYTKLQALEDKLKNLFPSEGPEKFRAELEDILGIIRSSQLRLASAKSVEVEAELPPQAAAMKVAIELEDAEAIQKIKELQSLLQQVRTDESISPEVKTELIEQANQAFRDYVSNQGSVDKLTESINKLDSALKSVNDTTIDATDLIRELERSSPEVGDIADNLVDDDVLVTWEDKFNKFAEKIRGLKEYIIQLAKETGEEYEDIVNRKFSVRQLSDNILRISFSGGPTVYYSEELDSFSTSLKEIRKDLLALNRKKNLQNLFEDFKGLKEFIDRELKVSVDDLSGKFRVFIADAEKGIKGISFAEGFTVYTDGVEKFSTSLRELKDSLSPEQLKQIEDRFAAVAMEAKRAGYSINNLKKIEEIGNGVTRFTFSMKEASGATRKMVIYSDQLGNVLVDNQKRFLSFTDAIIRNTLEAVRWSFAVTTVYGGLRKLNEAVREAIDNQERLASIAVVLGTGGESFREIFEGAKKVADELGITVGEVLDGYAIAFRIAGSEANTLSERSAKATALLRDALVLSKLTAEDSSKAMDLLISSIRQMNGSLEDSTKIMDKWVYLSRHAQVTVLDLAEATSLSGASATSAGVDFEELAGLIAGLSEITPYTGEEIGNILKSLFSNIQSDRASSELTKFGISIRTLDGELRDFDEILAEIKQKFDAGLISESDLAAIGRAIGGGARRGPQFVALIKSLDEAQRYTELLKTSNIELGYSYSAVDVKTQTVQSNINRLSNSFQKLASTVGESGGVLSGFNNLVTISNGLVNVLDHVIRATGEQGLTLALGYLANKFTRSAYTAQLFQNVLEWLIVKKKQLIGVTREQAIAEAKAEVTMERTIRSMNKYLAFATIASSALLSDNITQGVLTAIGGVAGYLASGNPIGAAIGASIGSALGDAADKFLGDFESELAPRVRDILFEAAVSGLSEGAKQGIEEGLGETRVKRLESDILDFGGRAATAQITLGAEFLSAVDASPIGDIFRDIISKAFGSGAVKGLEEIKRITSTESYKEAGFWEKGLAFLAKYPGLLEEFGVFIGDEQVQALQEYIDLLNLTSVLNPSQPIDEATASVMLMNAGIEVTAEKMERVSRLQEDFRNRIEEQFAAGEISYKEYRDALDQIEKFHVVLIPLAEILQDAFKEIGSIGEDNRDIYERLANVMLNGTKEEIDAVLALATAYREAANARDELRAKEIGEELDKQLAGIEANIARRELRLPVFMDLSNMSSEEIDLWLEEMARLQESYIKGAVEEGLVPSEEALRNYFSGIEPVFVYTKEGLLKAVGEGLDIQRFGAIARKNLEEAGLLDTSGQFQIKFLDISSKDRGKLEAALARAARTLEQFAPYYQLDPKPLGVVFKDNVTDIIHVDLLQLNLAMRELVELNRDQLDGIYNLPSDATFFVPWMAWELAAMSALNAETPTQPEEKTTPDINPDEVLDRFAKISKEIGKGIIDKLTDIENKTIPPDTMAELIQKMYEPVKRMVEIAVTQPGFAGSVSNIDEGMKNLEEYYKDKYWKYTVTPYGSVWRGMDVEPKQETEPQSKLDEFFNKLENFFDGLLDIYKNTSVESTAFINPQDITEAIRSLDVKTDLNINLMQNVQLQLDGKILYAQLMNYLYKDMLSRTRTSTVARINNII